MKNLKKFLVLMVSLAMLMTALIQPATVGAFMSDSQICSTVKLLQGEGAGVTAEYLAKTSTRLQSAIISLRLTGKEAEALAFTGSTTFTDANKVIWQGGKNVLAYLKANPQLGWVGNPDGSFEPNDVINAQAMHKVLLEALGYKQGVDFTWEQVVSFAKSLGFNNAINASPFKNGNIAAALVECLNLKSKGSSTTLGLKLIDSGLILRPDALDAGLKVPSLEPYKFTYLTNTGQIPFSFNSTESRFGKILKDEFNVEMNIQVYSGDWNQKLSLMLAAGDYGEMLWLTTDDLLLKYINAGALVSLDGYLDKMPNLQKRAKVQIPYWRSPAKDGRLYKWECGYEGKWFYGRPPNEILVRTDALEAMGWPKLLSEDDYLNFLKEALIKFPTTNGKKTIGMAAPFGESWGMPYLTGIMFEKGKYNQTTFAACLWDSDKQVFEDRFTNPYSKASYYMLNKFYRAGVLDKESFTDKLDQITEKGNSGQAISIFYCGWLTDGFSKTLTEASHPEMAYIDMPIKLNVQIQNGDARRLAVETTRSYNSQVVTKKCKNPERIFQIVDYIASEEGQILAGWGVEGVDYTIVDGKRVLSEKYKTAAKDDLVYGEKAAYNIFGSIFGLTCDIDKNGQNYQYSVDKVTNLAMKTDRQKEAYVKLGWKDQVWPWFGDPAYKVEVFQAGIIPSIVVPPDSDEGRIEQKLMDMRANYPAKLILAKTDEEFETLWNEGVKTYNSYNPQKVVDKMNELYKNAIEKIK